MAVYLGVARGRVDNSLGTQFRLSLSTTNDDPNNQGSDRASWKIEPGGSITLFVNIVDGNEQGTNTVTLTLYYEAGTGTLVRTLHSVGKPVDGTSYTVHGTTNGESSGTPAAGTLRARCRWVRTGTLADFTIDSDGGSTSPGGVGTVVYQDQGVLRAKSTGELTVSAYPAGATFAYPDTITLTATHTQRYADTNIETVALDVIDAADAQEFAGSTQEVGAGTTTQQFTVSDSWEAASALYGARLRAVGNSGLVPTSGAIKWTEFVASGSTVQDGENVKRSQFYTVDPRIKARAGDGSLGFHFQENLTTFSAAAHDSTYQMLSSDLGYCAAQVVNARNEGQNGLGFSLTSTSAINGQVTTVTGTTATADGLVGMTTMVEVCPNGKPGGAYDIALDITSPTSIDASTHFVNPTGSVTVLAKNPNIEVLSGIGPATAALAGSHFVPGEAMIVAAALVNSATGQYETIDASPASICRLFRLNPALGRGEYLIASPTGVDATDWLPLDGATAPTHAMSSLANDANVKALTFGAALTSGWSAYDVVAIPVLYNGATPYSGRPVRELVSDKNRHDIARYLSVGER